MQSFQPGKRGKVGAGLLSLCWDRAIARCRAAQAALGHFAPHGRVQRHLALRHEHAPVHLHANRLTQLDARAGAVGAKALNRFARGAGHICQGRGGQGQKKNQAAHVERIAQNAALDQACASAQEIIA